MGFKIPMEVDAEKNPDAVGEYLRSYFFAEKARARSRYSRGVQRQVGCYETFDWQRDVEPLPSLLIDDDHNHPLDQEPDDLCWACSSDGAKWTRGRKDGIECRWYWDGDGVLAFGLPDGHWLVNYDCKKDYGWTVIQDESELC